MRILVGILVFLILVAAGLGAAIMTGTISTVTAQAPGAAPEAAAPAAPRPRPATPSAPGAAQAPAGAAATPANAPQPKVVKNETYGDWVYTCVEAPGGNGAVSCGISQQISQSDTKQVIFLWRIGQDGKGGFASIWQTPTDIMVGRGITLDTGGEKPIVIPYQLCTSRGCQAIAGVDATFLGTLAKAAKATATLVLLNGKSVTINLSTKGLPEAIAQLQAK